MELDDEWPGEQRSEQGRAQTSAIGHVLSTTGRADPAAADQPVFAVPEAALSEVGDCTPLYAALVEAKLDMPKVTAASTGQDGHRKFQYADMADIANAIDPHIAKHGLVLITPFTGNADGQCRVTAVLAHKSGARLVGNIQFTADHDIKKLGGQSTYMARYIYCKMLQIAAEEDPNVQPDFSSRRDQQPQRPGPRPQPQTAAPKPADDGRVAVAKTLTPLFRALGIKGRVAAADKAEAFLGKPTKEATVEELEKLKQHLEDLAASQEEVAG